LLLELATIRKDEECCDNPLQLKKIQFFLILKKTTKNGRKMEIFPRKKNKKNSKNQKKIYIKKGIILCKISIFFI